MTFVKKGVALPLGAASDFDADRVFSSSVIKHAGRFFLYYGGFDGSNYRIGLAVSKDGLTFVKKGIIVPLGATDDFDDVRVYYPSVIKHAGRFFLYYTGYDGSNYRIGLAVSKDGLTFVKKGIIVPLGATDDFDDARVYSSSVIKYAGRFFLYYAGYDGSKYRIGLATSKDGLTFVKKGIIVPLGATDDFDDARVYIPSIIKHAGRFFLYYTGSGGSNDRIGLAVSKDGLTFVKKGVALPLGAASDFDDSDVYSSSVIKYAGQFFLFYAGYCGSDDRIGLAISKDGL